jgi:hypothetical protein
MNKNYDQEFGPGGTYAWPSDLSVAKGLIEVAPTEKSSGDCLSNYFFHRFLGSEHDEFLAFYEDEARTSAEAKARSRQELCKDARNWPLPYLVTSAVYKILSKNTEMSYNVWRHFLWLCLLYNEPLFGMLREKGWDKLYKNNIREGFKSQLRFEIKDLTGHTIIWSGEKGKTWFTCTSFTSYAYPEDVLRSLDLVGIDRDIAQSAVDQVFKLQSLTPFHDVLLD